MIVNKYLSLIALFVTTVHSIPQGNLAPAVVTQKTGSVSALPRSLPAAVPVKEVPKPVANVPPTLPLTPRASLDPIKKVPAPPHPTPPIHKRQVHNADYGSDGGPSGNPKASGPSQTSSNTETPQETSGSKSAANVDNKSNDQKRCLQSMCVPPSLKPTALA
ncbi:hypothetical protein PNOK_0583200 [Pyrrhoderma noxium]|uniref:Uncharacterized protein n=1 Tax=Pyrrhoderma noxium TaxID=2282107 RepID=A0A286UHG9_9AGAM|nr:hypothetical protein PNOK_0583200 [Pyrrhoderma noxium]